MSDSSAIAPFSSHQGIKSSCFNDLETIGSRSTKSASSGNVDKRSCSLSKKSCRATQIHQEQIFESIKRGSCPQDDLLNFPGVVEKNIKISFCSHTDLDQSSKQKQILQESFGGSSCSGSNSNSDSNSDSDSASSQNQGFKRVSCVH
jgi:hypothetical protein